MEEFPWAESASWYCYFQLSSVHSQGFKTASELFSHSVHLKKRQWGAEAKCIAYHQPIPKLVLKLMLDEQMKIVWK